MPDGFAAWLLARDAGPYFLVFLRIAEPVGVIAPVGQSVPSLGGPVHMLVPSSLWSISIMLSGASGPARAARLVEDGALGRSPHGWARGLVPAAFTIKFGFGVEHVAIFAGAPANVGVACGEILVAR